MKTIRIRNNDIGDGQRAYICAEIGINHMGDLEMAHRLMELADENSADAVKFQCFSADDLVSKELQPELHRELQKKEIGYSDLQNLRVYMEEACLSADLICSVFDPKSVDPLRDYVKVDALKIASGDITNYPLLQAVGESGLPVILSTGASDGREVGRAVELLNKSGCYDLIILHCVSLYPTDNSRVNLQAMDQLRVFGYPVGLSDHTIGNDIAIAAIARGANFIEKHFTFNHHLLSFQ